MFHHLSPFKTHFLSWKTGGKANKAAKLGPEQTRVSSRCYFPILHHLEPEDSAVAKPLRFKQANTRSHSEMTRLTKNDLKTGENGPRVWTWCSALAQKCCFVRGPACNCHTSNNNANNNNHRRNNGAALPCWISSFWACWLGQPWECSVDLQTQSGSVARTSLHAAEGDGTGQFGLLGTLKSSSEQAAQLEGRSDTGTKSGRLMDS